MANTRTKKNILLPLYKTIGARHRILTYIFIIFMFAWTIAACSRSIGTPDKHYDNLTSAKKSVSPPSLLIYPEDLAVVNSTNQHTSPMITGSIQPKLHADLRAEIAGIVLKVHRENGDIVRRGDLLVSLDDAAIRESLVAAETSERAAIQASEQAERQLRRLAQLRSAGVISAQAMENAEIERNNAQSELQAAKTRVAQSRQQLQRTAVRAPFDGIVSNQNVSAGDTAQVGKELLEIIDPHSMRFEGFVSAENINTIKIGQRVIFKIHGHADQEFIGAVTQINPIANSTTRQIEVLVNFVHEEELPSLAGFYAEGLIETAKAPVVTIPATALIHEGTKFFAWRVSNNKLQKISLKIGERNARTGDFLLIDGLSVGDKLLRHPNSDYTEGQAVQLATGANLIPGNP